MQRVHSIKHRTAKGFIDIEDGMGLRKKEAKKETKEWAAPIDIFIRFAEAFTSMHLLQSSSII
jgi:hypothetical protein